MSDIDPIVEEDPAAQHAFPPLRLRVALNPATRYTEWSDDGQAGKIFPTDELDGGGQGATK